MTTATGAYATAALLKSQSGISDTTDDTVLGYVCDRINQYIESKTGRVLAPITSAAVLIDIHEPATAIEYPKGIRAVSLLEVAQYTGGSYTTLESSQYFLRPGSADLRPGWPYTRICLTDRPSAIASFPVGYNTVRATMTTGWAAIPDDITEVALTAATRAWHSIQSGQQDIVGVSDMGEPVVSRFFSARDLDTLRFYSVDIPG